MIEKQRAELQQHRRILDDARCADFDCERAAEFQVKCYRWELADFVYEKEILRELALPLCKEHLDRHYEMLRTEIRGPDDMMVLAVKLDGRWLTASIEDGDGIPVEAPKEGSFVWFVASFFHKDGKVTGYARSAGLPWEGNEWMSPVAERKNRKTDLSGYSLHAGGEKIADISLDIEGKS